MKCPACGFDSPDDAGWCDLCKEPFRRKAAAPPPPVPLPPVPVAAAPAPPAPRPGGASDVPVEFEGFDPGERIPVIPRWVKYCAWAFLAMWALVALVVFGFVLGKKALGG